MGPLLNVFDWVFLLIPFQKENLEDLEKIKNTFIEDLKESKITSFNEIIRNNDLESLKKLIDEGLNPNFITDINRSLIVEAAYSNKIEIVEYLLQLKVD